MKKAIKGFAQLISMLLVFAGLLACMLEADSIDNQLTAACIGFAMVAIGAVIGAIVNRGDENVLDRWQR